MHDWVLMLVHPYVHMEVCATLCISMCMCAYAFIFMHDCVRMLMHRCVHMQVCTTLCMHMLVHQWVHMPQRASFNTYMTVCLRNMCEYTSICKQNCAYVTRVFQYVFMICCVHTQAVAHRLHLPGQTYSLTQGWAPFFLTLVSFMQEHTLSHLH